MSDIPISVYGLVARFDNPEAIVEATQKAHDQGYRKMEAYTPFPVTEITEILGFETKLQYIVLLGGIFGALAGFGLQYYVSVISYPLIIGGRPFNSLPSFITVIFELTVLIAAFVAVFGMLGLNGLPRHHHPVFNAKDFTTASRDRFFLCIEAEDPRFDPDKTKQFLQELNPEDVSEVNN